MDVTLLAQTFYLIEATDFEMQYLTERTERCQNPVIWEQQSGGYLPTIGALDDRPICLSFRWATLDGASVLFWHATSEVVDHGQIILYLRKTFPHLFPYPVYNGSFSSNATNFHCCVNALKARKATRASDPTSLTLTESHINTLSQIALDCNFGVLTPELRRYDGGDVYFIDFSTLPSGDSTYGRNNLIEFCLAAASSGFSLKRADDIIPLPTTGDDRWRCLSKNWVELIQIPSELNVNQ